MRVDLQGEKEGRGQREAPLVSRNRVISSTSAYPEWTPWAPRWAYASSKSGIPKGAREATHAAHGEIDSLFGDIGWGYLSDA